MKTMPYQQTTKPSVIIRMRAFNDEITVERAILSILSQTYRDFRFVIIISQGSCDKTASICQQYAAQDERITVMNKENQFVVNWIEDVFSEMLPESQYFCSLDADDEYLPLFLEKAIAFIEKNNLDMCRVCTSITEENSGKILNREFLKDDLIVERQDFGRFFPQYIRYCQTWWGMLLKSDVLLKIDPEEYQNLKAMAFNNYCVDSLQMQCVLTHLDRFGIVKERLHIQYVHNESYSTRYPEFRLYANFLLSDYFRRYLTEVAGFVSEENEDYIQFALARRLLNSFHLFLSAANLDDHQRLFYLYQALSDPRFDDCMVRGERRFPDLLKELYDAALRYASGLLPAARTQLDEEKKLLLSCLRTRMKGAKNDRSV